MCRRVTVIGPYKEGVGWYALMLQIITSDLIFLYLCYQLPYAYVTTLVICHTFRHIFRP